MSSVLQRRKSFEEVHDAGILSAFALLECIIRREQTLTLSVALETQEDVEKLAQISEAIEEKIEMRPNQDEMHAQNEHILNPTGALVLTSPRDCSNGSTDLSHGGMWVCLGASRRLSGSLASTAKELEKHITSDKIDHLLASRPDVEELKKKHVLSTSVAPQLQSVQKQLQRKMSADELAHRLDSRPDVHELREHGIVHDGASLNERESDCVTMLPLTVSLSTAGRWRRAEPPGDARQAAAPAQRRSRLAPARQAPVDHGADVAGRARQYVAAA